MEQIKVTQDTRKIAEFKDKIRDICDRSNELISIFETFQDWSRIKSIDDFIRLVGDPAKTFDDAIIAAVKIGPGRQVNAEVAASLFNVHRSEFMNLVAGIPIIDDNCIPCKKVNIRKGKRAISIHEFSNYQEFLTFSNGRFAVDQTAVDDYAFTTWTLYAKTPKEVEIVKHFGDLVDILNRHSENYQLNNSQKQSIAGSLRLHLTEAISGQFMVNSETVKNEILKLRQNEKYLD